MGEAWQALDVERDSPTFALLHLASQMLGKLRVAYAPWANHGWHVTLLPVAEGLIMPPIAAGTRRFTLTLDLCAHEIRLRTSGGEQDSVSLEARSVAELHGALAAMLDRHGLPSHFHGRPNEVPDPVPFRDDVAPRFYNRDSAERLRDALSRIVPVFDRFRAGFQGKASPVHFFWGSFDLAVTRFSGRPAPPHPGGVPNLADRVTRSAYSHEVFSAGCPACEEAIAIVKNVACPSCEVTVLDMSDANVTSRAKSLGIRSVPAVVIDGKLADCCSGHGPDEATLRAAGLGQAIT